VLVTTRGRLGWTWWDKSMIYVTGGGARAKVDASELRVELSRPLQMLMRPRASQRGTQLSPLGAADLGPLPPPAVTEERAGYPP
jgi:hypothetical protein